MMGKVKKREKRKRRGEWMMMGKTKKREEESGSRKEGVVRKEEQWKRESKEIGN